MASGAPSRQVLVNNPRMSAALLRMHNAAAGLVIEH
jgi:hypothetical protein